MSEHELTRNMALRIGLAAKALNNVSPGEMLGIVGDAVALPLTEKKMTGLSMDKLRTADGGKLFGETKETLKNVLSILKGKSGPDDFEMPSLDPYEDGDMPGSIRVAMASNGGEDFDGHFGSCSRFLVYQMSASEIRLIAVRSTADDVEAEDKNKYRADLIRDCQVLYIVSIGGPAAAKVVRADIHPIKQPNGGKARDVLTQLQDVIAGSPPPWLAKAMGLGAEERAKIHMTEEYAS